MFNPRNPFHLRAFIVERSMNPLYLLYAFFWLIYNYFTRTIQVKNEEIISKREIKKGEIIGLASNLAKYVTDLNLSDKFFERFFEEEIDENLLNEFYNDYLDISHIQGRTNVKLINICGIYFIKAIKRIKNGEKLSRIQGFPHWLYNLYIFKYPQSTFKGTIAYKFLDTKYRAIDPVYTDNFLKQFEN